MDVMGDSGQARIPRRYVAELGRFFAGHDRWLFGHACVRTHGDRELAADLVQDTFEAAARSWADATAAMRTLRRFTFTAVLRTPSTDVTADRTAAARPRRV